MCDLTVWQSIEISLIVTGAITFGTAIAALTGLVVVEVLERQG